MYTEKQLRERAHKRVEFRSHLVAWCIVNAMLWIIWYLTGAGYKWPVWPMAVWSIGLIFHYIFEYRNSRLLSEEEEYKKLKREELKREAQANDKNAG